MMRAILESDRPILVVDVQRIICALSIHCCLTLAACDRPTAAPPSPVGTWESRQQSEPPYLFTRLELKADGSFQRVSGAMPSSREESVIDSLGGNWKVAVVKSDGNDVQTQDRATITLSYWVPARSELPVGATVAEKKAVGPILDGKEEWRIEERVSMNFPDQQTRDALLSADGQSFLKLK